MPLGVRLGRWFNWRRRPRRGSWESIMMKRTPLSIPEIALIGGTRAALGAGVALLLGSRLNEDQFIAHVFLINSHGSHRQKRA